MGPHDLLRAILRSFAIILGSSVVLILVWSQPVAYGFALGGVWSAANLWALKGLIEAVVERHLWRIIIFSQLKLPILYGVGGFVLLKAPLSIPAAIVSFHIPFVIVGIESYRCQKREDVKTGETDLETNKEGRFDGGSTTRE